VGDPVEDYIAHYASKYYDPAKAKEYYERTKELKGRNSAAELDSAHKKEAWTVTRSNISKEKQAESEKAQADRRSSSEKAQADQKARLETLRTTANAARDQLVAKIKGLLGDIKADVDAQIEKEREGLKARLESRLSKIPETATPERRAFLERQNSKIRQEYTETLNTNIQKIKSDAQEKATAGRKEYSEERKKTAEALRSGLTSARDSYKASREEAAKKYTADREASVQKYKAVTDREYQNIKNS